MHAMIPLICVACALMFGAALFGMDAASGAAITVTTTAETLAATGGAVTLPTTNGKAVVRGWVALTVGASTTAVTLTVYAGTAIGGRVVGAQNANAGNFTAGALATFSVEFVDMLANVGAAQYCLSVKQTGASGNGTIQNALIQTSVLSG